MVNENEVVCKHRNQKLHFVSLNEIDAVDIESVSGLNQNLPEKLGYT